MTATKSKIAMIDYNVRKIMIVLEEWIKNPK